MCVCWSAHFTSNSRLRRCAVSSADSFATWRARYSLFFMASADTALSMALAVGRLLPGAGAGNESACSTAQRERMCNGQRLG